MSACLYRADGQRLAEYTQGNDAGCPLSAPAAAQILTELKKLDIGIKPDDFGTGYSSLHYLCNLPCDSLRIDRSFVKKACEDPLTLEVIRTIISLAGHLGKEVIAEGLETAEQAGLLRKLGCEFGQGYYFTAPLPPDAVPGYVAQLREAN